MISWRPFRGLQAVSNNDAFALGSVVQGLKEIQSPAAIWHGSTGALGPHCGRTKHFDESRTVRGIPKCTLRVPGQGVKAGK